MSDIREFPSSSFCVNSNIGTNPSSNIKLTVGLTRCVSVENSNSARKRGVNTQKM